VPPGGGKVEMAVDSQELSPVMVYPNPASGEATVQIELDFSTGSVKIFDIREQPMLQRELEANTTLHPLPLSGLPSGIYTIHVMLAGERYTLKLVMEQAEMLSPKNRSDCFPRSLFLGNHFGGIL
jgi:hypothetical protein